MRKMMVAAATAAALGTVGLAVTAQAQPVTHRADPAVAETVVAGIPGAFTVHQTGTENCTWKVTGLPGSVTAASGGAHKCSDLIDGVWPTPGTKTVTAKATAGGATTTFTITVTVKTSPGENDAVGVGSDTTTFVIDQLSSDYNTTIAKTAPHQYSWNAVNPISGQIGDSIREKADCPSIARPDGSSAGITQLDTFAKSSSGPLCTNFARSSRARASTDPPFAAGGIAFVNLAADALTWSTQAVNDAPASLTQTQLNAIYTCADTNWDQVGGKNAPIQAFLPQSGSGTLSAWMTAIGVTTPGPCVSNVNNTLEENEGVNPALQTPEAIFPYSIGDYISQADHSAVCVNKTTCTANSSGVICKPAPGKNPFSCDIHGTMVLKEINGIKPTTGSGTRTVINSAFPSTFGRTLFDVVPYDPSTADHIPGATNPVGGVNLEKIFRRLRLLLQERDRKDRHQGLRVHQHPDLRRCLN